MKGTSFVFLLFLFACASEEELKPKTVKQKLHSKMDEFRQCFLESNSYQGRDAPDRGFVRVSFTLNSEGKVVNQKIAESSFKDANMHACMLGQLKAIKFDPPPQAKDGGIINVTHELNFHRRQN